MKRNQGGRDALLLDHSIQILKLPVSEGVPAAKRGPWLPTQGLVKLPWVLVLYLIHTLLASGTRSCFWLADNGVHKSS